MSATESAAGRVVGRIQGGSDTVHAVLFYGPQGGGMEEAAMSLAQNWLCPNKQPGAPACGDCAVCRSFASGRMVDFFHVKPWGPSNMIKNGAIRKGDPLDAEAPDPPLLDFFRTPPLMAAAKVALFEQADRMNGPTANALLKTLEEPPAYGKVILTTTEFSRILPTVRSRCMSVACSYTDQPGSEIEQAFGGSPGLSQLVRDNLAAYTQLWDVFESSLSAPHGAAIALAERTREATDAIAKALDSNARAAHVEILRCLSQWLVFRRPDSYAAAQAAVETHRLVLGNVNVGAAYDLLWARILTP